MHLHKEFLKSRDVRAHGDQETSTEHLLRIKSGAAIDEQEIMESTLSSCSISKFLSLRHARASVHGNQCSNSMAVTLLHYRKASVSHDYVYGLLGLLSSKEIRQVPIDYNQSHLHAYAAFMRLLWTSTIEDDLRATMRLQYSCDTDHPTWQADLSAQENLYAGGMLLEMDTNW
jgi:hypothetical protein